MCGGGHGNSDPLRSPIQLGLCICNAPIENPVQLSIAYITVRPTRQSYILIPLYTRTIGDRCMWHLSDDANECCAICGAHVMVSPRILARPIEFWLDHRRFDTVARSLLFEEWRAGRR